MKRTTELIFTITGIGLFGLLAIGSGLLMLIIHSNTGTEKLVEEFLHDENITEISTAQAIDYFSNGMLYLFVVSIIFAIIGFLALFCLKGNKKPSLASKLLIITAILGTLATLITGIFGGLSYLIAGIVTLSKKDPHTERQHMEGDFDVRHQS